jgi:hypothetical protein
VNDLLIEFASNVADVLFESFFGPFADEIDALLREHRFTVVQKAFRRAITMLGHPAQPVEILYHLPAFISAVEAEEEAQDGKSV